MTQLNKKKPSLFKQRMTQNNKVINNGFPQVIKIDTKSQMEQEIVEKKIKTMTILQKLKQEKIVDQKQLNQINKQNQEYLNKLSQKQIIEYQKLIEASFSQKFIAKFRQKNNQKSKNKIQVEQQQQIQQIFFPEDIHFQKKFNFLISISIEQKLYNLQLNLDTKLLNLDPQSQNKIQLKKIQNMLLTDNNQTIIMASKLLHDIIHIIQNTPFKRSLIIINNQYFHKQIVLDFIGNKLIKKIYNNVKSNQFISCKIQCIKTILKFIQCGGNLNQEQILYIFRQSRNEQRVLQQLKRCIDLVKHKYFEKNEILQILGLLNKQKMQQQLVNTINRFQKQYLYDMDIISQKILLQQGYFGDRQDDRKQSTKIIKYYNNRFERKEQEQGLDLDILFKLVQNLKIRLKIQDQQIIRTFLMKLGDSIKNYVLSLYSKILTNNLHSISTYKILFIIKNIQKLSYITIIQNINKLQHQQTKLIIQSYLIILNIQIYLSQQWDQSQIQIMSNSLNHLQNWIQSNQSLSYQLLFIKLIKIFKHQKQSYHKLNQISLNRVFLLLIKKINHKLLALIFKSNKIKQYINYYNYNSFGNIVFSKILIYLSSLIFQQQSQILIISQVFQRYPFIFYEAGLQKQFYGQQQLYLFKNRSLRCKQQLGLVYKIIIEGKSNKLQLQNNKFIQLLK